MLKLTQRMYSRRVTSNAHLQKDCIIVGDRRRAVTDGQTADARAMQSLAFNRRLVWLIGGPGQRDWPAAVCHDAHPLADHQALHVPEVAQADA